MLVYRLDCKGIALAVTLISRMITLLGHVIRDPDADPMRAITFNAGTVDTEKIGWKRVGRPQINWIEDTMREAWEEVRHYHPEANQKYCALPSQNEQIKQKVKKTNPLEWEKCFRRRFFNRLYSRNKNPLARK